MGETRGYLSIVDRTDGWGPGVVAEDQPDSDAVAESRNARIAKTKVVRKRVQADDQPDNADRSASTVGDFDPSAGADNGYGLAWDDGLTIGTDNDLEAETGSNTALSASHPDVDVSQRASKPLPTWNADGSVTPNASYTSDPVATAKS
jgi:hypothetical protein